AAAISAATFAPDAPVAYVAFGGGFPDALAGGPAAGAAGGPVLLVAQNAIPQPTADELCRLKPANIVVLGGQAAVSTDVENQLHSYTTGTVGRSAGTDRYTTSVAVSANAFAPGVPKVYLATGLN